MAHRTSRKPPKGISKEAWRVLAAFFGYAVARDMWREVMARTEGKLELRLAAESVILLHWQNEASMNLREWATEGVEVATSLNKLDVIGVATLKAWRSLLLSGRASGEIIDAIADLGNDE